MKQIKYTVYGKNINFIELLIVLVSACLLTYLIARNIFGKTLVFGDSPWVNIHSSEIIQDYIFSMWTPAAYGDNLPKPQGYIIQYLFAKIASLAGNNYIYYFLMHCSIPLSFISFYFYSKRFCDRIFVSIFGASFYLINPVTISYFLSGGFMWALVFLPLSVNYYIMLVEEPELRSALKATIFTTLTIWSFPTITLTLFLGSLVILLSYVTIEENKKNYLKKLLPKLCVYVLFLLVCTMPYILSTIFYICSSSFSLSNILNDFQYTYREVTLPNLFRLAGNSGSPQDPLGYNSYYNLSNEIGYIIPTFSLSSIFWIKVSKIKRRILSMLTLLLFSISIALFIKFLSNSGISWILSNNVIFWTLRNPFKIQLLILISITSLFIFTLEKLFNFLKLFFNQKKLIYTSITFALIFLAISHMYFYNTFVFKGYFGVDEHPGLNQALANSPLIQIVNSSLSWANNKTFRGIIFPFDHRTELYVEFTNMLVYPCRLGQSCPPANVINDALIGNINIDNLLRLFNIKYIYVNNKFENTGHCMILPKNLNSTLLTINDTNLFYYSKDYYTIVVKNVLPTVYVSKNLILCSNIETIDKLNDSIFQSMPVFIEIKNIGQNITFDKGYFSKTFLYTFDIPYACNYSLYVEGYSEEPEKRIYYIIDGTEKEAPLEGQTQLKSLSQIQLQEGSHKFMIKVEGIKPFTELDTIFIDYGNGTCCRNNQSIEVKNGTIITLNEFKNFDLTLDFRALNFGKENWHAPYIYFLLSNDTSYYIVLNKNGYIELAKDYKGQHYPFLIAKQTNLDFKKWNNLRVVKVDDTVMVYLNNKYVLGFKEPLLNVPGKIGLGAHSSAALFDKVMISKNVVRGIWFIPNENVKTCSTKITEIRPGYYSMQINNSKNSWFIIFIGEKFDMLWEAKVNGKIVKDHLEANVFGNCWVIKSSEKVLNVEIFYKPNVIYPYIQISTTMFTGLILSIAYLPENIFKKIRLLIYKNRE
ncbi:MAG: family 16 glycoside hydrolase [Nitrososphaeria archaeon]